MKCLVVLWLDRLVLIYETTPYESQNDGERRRQDGRLVLLVDAAIAHDPHPSTKKSVDTKRCRCVNVYTFIIIVTFEHLQIHSSLASFSISSLCDSALARLRQSTLAMKDTLSKGFVMRGTKCCSPLARKEVWVLTSPQHGLCS